jgi:O-antigen/teichoic acid export membrane protein
MLLGLIANTFQALERFDILNRLGVIFVTLQTIAVVLLLKWGFSLTEVITSNVIISLVNFLVYSGYLIKLLPFLKNPSWDLGIVKQLFKFGGFVSISSVVSPLLINSEKIFLSIFRPLASLTYYYVPFSIVNRLSMIPSAFSSVIFPAFSFLQGLNKKEANKELHYRSTLYIFFFYIYFAAFFIVFGAKFFSLWLGDDFARNSSTILTILVLAGLANAIAWPSLVALQGLGKPHVPAIFHSIEIIIYLPCAFILISKFGTIGAAVAWLIRVLTDALLLHTASCNVFGENIFKWYYDLLYRAITPLAICILSFYWLRTLDLPLLSFFSIAAIFFSMLIYTYIVWKYGLDNFGRGKAVEFLRNL